ncbi:hypothetical protein KUTeg_000538 [Tegillarca granosa]|uniref:Uncharacterized protein n=1 Tax=Tegillarca granosa TaxID=220873 RepID=A0ABQ9FYV8_TEGGR|nr:hypothetical protein KUTeg_000538 [Tegillarca granosa]
MADGMFLFWGSGSTPCMRVMMVLEEKGFSGYHQRQISFEKKENKCDEIMKLNPRGQVPTFTDKDGDIVINESQAICLYLEDTYKNQGVQLIPTDPQKKGFVLQRLCEEGEGRFICGDEFTMADVYLFTHLALCVRMGLDITKYRMLSEYYNRIKRRESVQKSWPPDWEDTPNLTFMTGI